MGQSNGRDRPIYDKDAAQGEGSSNYRGVGGEWGGGELQRKGVVLSAPRASKYSEICSAGPCMPAIACIDSFACCQWPAARMSADGSSQGNPFLRVSFISPAAL